MKKLIAIMVVLALCLSVLPMASAAGEIAIVVDAHALNWSAVNLYYWNAGNPVGWPGTAMTALPGADGWFYIWIPAGSYNIIFNNGSEQTGDITGQVDGTGNVICQLDANKNFTKNVALPSGVSIPANSPAPQSPTYIIAGMAELCGNAWNTNDTNNGMTENGDGTYTKVYDNVPAGDLMFKVVRAGTWDGAVGGDGPDGNYIFNNSAAGSVTITFDGTNITVTGPNVGPYVPPTNVTYHVAGNGTAGGSWMNGVAWDPAASANAMTNTGGSIWSISFTGVSTGDYEFKVTDGAANWAGQTWPSSNYTFTVYVECDVTITFDADSKEITVTATNNGLTDPGAGGSGGAGGSTPAPTVSYFVAGSESLCGVAWDEKAEANKMTESSGVYTKTYNNVPVGDYEFKVTNGTWDDGCSWGKDGQNFKFSVTAACDVTVTFNPDTKEITVTGSGVELPAPPAPGYYVAGNGAAGNSWVNGAGWECDNASNKMTESNGVYTIKYTNVAPGEYEFKVTDGTWNKAWPGENYKFKVTTACDVTVTFNPTTGAVSVKGAGIPSADTADSTNLVALTAVLVLSAAGLAVLTKKKEF